MLLAVVAQALHLLLVLGSAPLLAGWVAWLEARMQGRAGPSIAQPWRDIARALRRQPVVAEGSSWLFRAAPAARLAVLVAVAAVLPSFAPMTLLAPAADLVVIAGLLGLARAVAMLGALDEGSAISGQAAAEMLARGAMAVPALLLVVFALALAAGGTGLADFSRVRFVDAPGLLPAMPPLGLALLLVATADGRKGAGRELSGRHEAVAAAGDALRLTIWLALVAALLLPPFLPPVGPEMATTIGDWLIFLPVWLAKMALLGFAVAATGCLASAPATRNAPGLLALATLLAVLGVALLFGGQVLR